MSNKLNQLISVYKDGFNDSEDFINYFFNNNISDSFTLEKDNKIVSAFHFTDKDIKFGNEVKSIKYLVGLSTLKEYQKKGYATKLLRTEFKNLYKQGIDTIFLHPAIDFKFYSKLNFKILDYTTYLQPQEGQSEYFLELCVDENRLLDIFLDYTYSYDVSIYRDKKAMLDRIQQVYCDDGTAYVITDSYKDYGYVLKIGNEIEELILTKDCNIEEVLKIIKKPIKINNPTGKVNIMARVINPYVALDNCSFNSQITKSIKIFIEDDIDFHYLLLNIVNGKHEIRILTAKDNKVAPEMFADKKFKYADINEKCDLFIRTNIKDFTELLYLGTTKIELSDIFPRKTPYLVDKF